MILEDIEAIQEEAQGLHDLMRIIQSSTHLYYGPELVPTQPSLSSDQEVNKVPSCWHTIPMYQVSLRASLHSPMPMIMGIRYGMKGKERGRERKESGDPNLLQETHACSNDMLL